jgi:hypothetical protein
MLSAVFAPYLVILALNNGYGPVTSGEPEVQGRISVVSAAHELLSEETISFRGSIESSHSVDFLGVSFHNPTREAREAFLTVSCPNEKPIVHEASVGPDNSILFFEGYSTAYFALESDSMELECTFEVDPGTSAGVWIDIDPQWQGSNLFVSSSGSQLPTMFFVDNSTG